MKPWTVAFVVAVTVSTADARADESTPVIVLVSSKGGPFASRLCAELQAIGFRVVMRESMQRELPDDTLAVARIIEGSRRRIEVQGSPDIHGPADPVVIDAPEDDDVGAIQIAERVRAYFQPLAEQQSGLRPNLDVTVEREPPRAIARPPMPSALPPAPVLSPPYPRPAPPPIAPSTPSSSAATTWSPGWSPLPPKLPRRSWSLGGSAGVAASLDVGGVGFDALASFYVNPIRWFRLAPFVSVPIVATKVGARGGSASLYAGMLGTTAGFALFDGKVLGLFAGGGFAGVWLHAVGHPDKGFVGSADDAFTSTLFIHLLGRIHLTKSLALAPQANLGFALPAPNIRFGTQSVHRWGLPWGLFALSFEVDWLH